MNRAEFMRRLTELLGDVPPTEREEAIQYYNDYFDDAGAENENGVIASLGTPEELARTIKAGLNDGGSGGEFTESGFTGYTPHPRDEVMRTGDMDGAQANGTDSSGQAGGTQWGSRTGGANQTQSSTHSGNAYYEGGYYKRTAGEGVYGGRQDKRNYDNPYGQTSQGAAPGSGTSCQRQEQKQGMSGGMIVLIVILAVLTSPVWIGLLGGFFGVAAGLLAALFGIFLAFLIIGVALVVVSAALLVTGIAVMFSAPLAGLCVVGTALVLFSLGLVFVWLMVLMAGLAIPALVRGVVSLCQRIFHRGGARV